MCYWVPGKFRVSKMDKEPLSLGFSKLTWIWESMELMCCRTGGCVQSVG